MIPARWSDLFRKAHMLLAIHAEDEATIRANMKAAVPNVWGDAIPMEEHPRDPQCRSVLHE